MSSNVFNLSEAATNPFNFRDRLIKISILYLDYLLANETMTGKQFADLMEGREISQASTTSLTDGYEEPEMND